MVKTVRYENPRYVGDPVNVINLFNRFEVDEITLLDIRATVDGRKPPYELIEHLASECWVPLAYGGGVRSTDEIRRILSLGVEKVVIGSACVTNPRLISDAAAIFGSQAVIVSIDVRRRRTDYEVFIESGRRGTGTSPEAYGRQAEALGAGELLLNAIDQDGVMAGYDLELIRRVSASVTVPVIACGGAGERADLPRALGAGASAVAAGSLFVYRGRERGVLVNFPERPALEALLTGAQA
jgi:imidazole glycerol-phosphate synthase subunit HisF